MPRTVWTRARGDEDKSDRELRDAAEQTHWRRQQEYFQWPISYRSPTEDANWRHDSRETTSRGLNLGTLHGEITQSLEGLDDDVVRLFCFKDCALYASFVYQLAPADFYERIHRRWFPSRADDTDISHKAFFCQYINYQLSKTLSMPEQVGQLASFHKELCDQLDKKIPCLPAVKPREFPPAITPDILPPDHQLLMPDAVYQLRPTFRKCLMIMPGYHDENYHFRRDREREAPIPDPGAIIVWLRAEDAPELTDGMSKITGEGLGEVVAFKYESFGAAMEYILSSSPARSEKRREWHGHYQEVLDQNSSVFGTPCQCSFCN